MQEGDILVRPRNGLAPSEDPAPSARPAPRDARQYGDRQGDSTGRQHRSPLSGHPPRHRYQPHHGADHRLTYRHAADGHAAGDRAAGDRAAEQDRGDSPSPTHRRRALAGRPQVIAAALVALLAALVYPATRGGAEKVSVGPSGRFTLTPGVSLSADSGASIGDGVASGTFSFAGRPTGGGLYVGLQVRSASGSGYRAKARALADGSLRTGLSKVVDGTETNLGSVPVPGSISGANTVLHVELRVSGDSPVRLAARGWLDGDSKPGWQYQDTDDAPGALANPGSLRGWSYLSTSAQSPRVTVDYADLVVEPSPIGGPPAPPIPTLTPAPSPTATTPAPASPTARPTASSPTPSPTSQPAPRPPGGMPGPENTGVPPGTALHRHDGDLVITRAGASYDALDVHGFVVVQAPNVKITRSIIRGGVATFNRGLVTNTTPTATNFVIEDSELTPQSPSVYLDGIKGGNFTARRLNIHGTVDSVKAHGNNVLVEASWLHGEVRYASDPAQGGGPTHNDGVQVLGGSNVHIVGNNISGAGNAGMQVSQDYAPTVGLVFDGNWVDNGDCTVKLTHQGEASMSTVHMNGNRFGRTTTIKDCAILRTNATSLSQSDNRWEDNGQQVPIRVYG